MCADTHLQLSHVLTGPHQPSPLTKHTIIKTKRLLKLLNKKFTLDLTNFHFFFTSQWKNERETETETESEINKAVNKPYPSLPKVAQCFFFFSFDETVNKPYPNLPKRAAHVWD